MTPKNSSGLDVPLYFFWVIGLFCVTGLLFSLAVLFATDGHEIADYHDAASGVAAYATPEAEYQDVTSGVATYTVPPAKSAPSSMASIRH